MNHRSVTFSAVPLLVLGIGSMTGCKPEPANGTPAPRPVSVLQLREIDPIKPLQITGSVHPWKEQDVAFEVGGRVKFIVQQGTQLEGRWEENGEVQVTGSVLASMDDDTYRAAVVAAGAEVEYAKVTLEKVLPAELAEAEANRVNQQAEMDRVLAIPETAVASIEPIRARANRDMSVARVEQAQAGLTAGKATLAKAQAALTQAELDLQHATLYSPFACEVAEVFVEAGGFAEAGQRVAHLVMMDPIKIDVTVSPETARRLRLRDSVRLYIAGEKEPVIAAVSEKATVADPKTRTLRVSIMTRNRRMTTQAASGHPVITQFTYLPRQRDGDETSPFMVEETRSLREDSSGHFVWAAPDQRLGWAAPDQRLGDRADMYDRPVTLRRFSVVPSDVRVNFQGLFLFRGLSDIGELQPNMLIAMDVPDSFQDGQMVVFSQSDWRLRPGQLVQVLLSDSPPAPGLYVPMTAILNADEHSGVVFVEKEGLARRVDIRILGHAGELIQIAPVDASSTLVQPGANIILDYIHFLQDREPVSVIQRRELEL